VGLRDVEKLIVYVRMKIEGISGHLILLMAPMASGKGSLMRYIREAFPQIMRTVSCTTRERRPGEVDGIDYYFTSRSDFEEKIKDNAFIEWAEFGGNLYGTLKSEIVTQLQNGAIVLNEADLQGIVQLIEIIPRECYTILYIDAGNWETLKARALSRAPMSETELALRYERYLAEEAFKDNVDFVIKNGDGELAMAHAQVHHIIEDIIKNVSQPS